MLRSLLCRPRPHSSNSNLNSSILLLRRGSHAPPVPNTPLSSSQTSIPSVSRKRVLGVIAHINSGKTTTTEALLYHSGALSRKGNVDVGDTTTDFLPAERERGITVSSAAAQLTWRGHHVHLIDSPGHLDFTYEVERALRAMDSAVVVLDAVAGIQPQTEVVWRQAKNNHLAKLVFLNKLDRDGSDFERVVNEIRKRFAILPIVTHVPIFENRHLKGVCNLLSEDCSENDGGMIKQWKEKLVESCAEIDDSIMEMYVEGKQPCADTMVNAIRHACVNGTAVPVLCGASLRDIGVEHLLNAIVAFLPSPMERNRVQQQQQHFVAYAFKVLHDRHRGRLVFLRAFTGNLTKRTRFINTSNMKKETPTRLLRVFADKYVDIDTVEMGDIFAAVGLKHTNTGDTIMLADVPKQSQVVLERVPQPPAVFAVAVEPDSLSNESDLDVALNTLVDEDGSLELRRDEDTGETLLIGMGELHLEVALDHMRRKLAFEFSVSAPRVAYRESISSDWEDEEFQVDTHIGNNHLCATVRVHVKKLTKTSDNNNTNQIDIVLNEDEDKIEQLEMTGRQGVIAALGRGPLLGMPVHHVHVIVHVNHTVDAASLRAAAAQATIHAIRKATPVLLEPVMDVRTIVPNERVGDVVSELTHPTKRRGVMCDITQQHNYEVEIDHNMTNLKAIVPVQGLIGFATKFRSLTKGRGDLHMRFSRYEQITGTAAQRRIIDEQETKV